MSALTSSNKPSSLPKSIIIRVRFAERFVILYTIALWGLCSHPNFIDEFALIGMLDASDANRTTRSQWKSISQYMVPGGHLRPLFSRHVALPFARLSGLKYGATRVFDHQQFIRGDGRTLDSRFVSGLVFKVGRLLPCSLSCCSKQRPCVQVGWRFEIENLHGRSSLRRWAMFGC